MMEVDAEYRILMDYAMRALSRRAHTELELRRKLRKRAKHTTLNEDKIIKRLLDLKLLDDQAYLDRQIEMAIQVRFQGPYKIAERLRFKGISLNQIKERWDFHKVKEREVAQKALNKIDKKLQDLPNEKRIQKCIQFLSNRGFSAEIILELAKSENPM